MTENVGKYTLHTNHRDAGEELTIALHLIKTNTIDPAIWFSVEIARVIRCSANVKGATTKGALYVR